MNFLDNIWLIPLFPLFGAAVMLLIGKKLDPQAPSAVTVAPGVEPGHAAGHGAGRKVWISLFCPGMVLLSLLFSIGAVIQLANKPQTFWYIIGEPVKVHEVTLFKWLAGFPFHLADE